MTMTIILIVILLTMALFHLKCSLMSSICTLWFITFSTIMAFSFYELAANLFLSRGFGIGFAHAGSFALILVLGFALLRAAGDFLIGSNIDLGSTLKTVITMTCGFLSGVIVAGNILVVMGMLPVQHALVYSRFDPEKAISINSPKKAALNVDGFVAGLYNTISRGSFRSDKSFAVLHPNFISQNHLNRLKVNDGVLTVCARETLKIPSGKNQQPLRRWKTIDHNVVLVRMGISDQDMASGGAKFKSGEVSFFPAQIQLIYSDDTNSTDKPFLGKVKTLYPIGFFRNNRIEKKGLTETIKPPNNSLKKRAFWMDAVFDLPEGSKPLLLQFKQGSLVDLTSYQVVERTDETEQALKEQEKN